MKDKRDNPKGDEAPEWKHFMIVMVAIVVLISIAWLTWFKFGWFH